ncbi:MAG: YgiW/YdeI family stress tolerance OB fold protein [Escherichia coli]|nr:YgiW/YdeI family stress tolerance OB fold protein [Escherichia coli]
MKKFAAVIAVMALCSAPVMAAEQGGFSGPSATQSQAGGFQGPNGSVTTVESAKSLRDDTWVTLRGNIVERISDDLYVFKDASGTINVPGNNFAGRQNDKPDTGCKYYRFPINPCGDVAAPL